MVAEQAVPMPDGDVRKIEVPEVFVEPCLVHRRERARGLVQHCQLGHVKETPHGSHTLLLAQRQHARPVRDGVEAALEPLRQAAQAGAAQQHAQLGVAGPGAFLVAPLRVQQLGPQASPRHVGSLRQEHALLVWGAHHLPMTASPEAREHTQQAALAHAGAAGEEEPHRGLAPAAARGREAERADDRLRGAGHLRCEVLDLQDGTLHGDARDARRLIPQTTQGRQQTTHAVRRGGEVGDHASLVDDKRDGLQRSHEGHLSLGHGPKVDGTIEIHPRDE
mmetsp:Transcript_123585/g.384748  ORF Transcript_123585/g.384748 Transcript_123585/m.384748 type:complete len:278 (+) Transcript_123585:185-1018(+)